MMVLSQVFLVDDGVHLVVGGSSMWYMESFIFSEMWKGPICLCTSLRPAPFTSTNSREWGLTRTSSPSLNSFE